MFRILKCKRNIGLLRPLIKIINKHNFSEKNVREKLEKSTIGNWKGEKMHIHSSHPYVVQTSEITMM